MRKKEAVTLAETLRKQALILTMGNGITRGMGFLLRLCMARWMGAEALGVMEMANSVGMLALTPVTAGIPSAMSRMVAQRPACDQPHVLRAGLHLIRRLSMWLIPLLVVLSPALAWLLGDMHTLPAILLTAPDILLLGMCSVYCGYCYGQDDTLLPSLTECAEQAVRFFFCAVLLLSFSRSSVPVSAALPGVAEALAALAVVLIFHHKLRLPPSHARPSQALTSQLFHLAAPSTLSRLCATGMRMLSTVLLPVCLRRSGLSAEAATAQYGLLNGMAMPLMMLPGVVTSALCMIATPIISRQEAAPARMRRTIRQLTLSAVGIGAAAGAALYLLADFISVQLYRQAALAPLVRFMCPMTVIFALHQVQYGMVAGRGLQKKALGGTILSSIVSLLGTALLAAHPGWRLFGAAAAMMLGQIVSIVWDAVLIRQR